MRPVIIGVRRKPTDSNEDLPKINGFRYKPMNNKKIFPHKGPIVLITNIIDTLLPGEQVILGPYCDCSECHNQKKEPVENPISTSRATNEESKENRDKLSASTKRSKHYRIFASTPKGNPQPETDKMQTNQVGNKKTVQQPADSKNVQTNPSMEFSELDSDSGWDKRQDLITQLNKDLELQVEMELNGNKVKESKKDCNSNELDGGEKRKSDSDFEKLVSCDKGDNTQESASRGKKTDVLLLELSKESSVVKNHLLEPNQNGDKDGDGFKVPEILQPWSLRLRTKKTVNGEKLKAYFKDTDGFEIPGVVVPASKSKKRKQVLNEDNQGGQDVSDVKVSKISTSRRKRQTINSKDEVFVTPKVQHLEVSGKRRTLYSPSTQLYDGLF